MDFNLLLKKTSRMNAGELFLKGGAPPAIRVGRDILFLDRECVSREDMLEVFKSVTDTNAAERYFAAGFVLTAFTVPQLGRFKAVIHKQAGSVAMVLRHIRSPVPTFATLTLPGKLFRRLADDLAGLIIVGGPAGSGRTTTCAAMIEYLNGTVQRHIVTVENALEYEFDAQRCLIDRIEVGRDAADVASGVRTAMMLDPDVLVLGELSDPESTALAVEAAAGGRLVIADLRARNLTRLLGCLTRWVKSGELCAVEDLAGVLKAVTCQRLIRRDGSDRSVPVLEILVPTSEARRLIVDGQCGELPSVASREKHNPSCGSDQYLKLLVLQERIRRREALAAAADPVYLSALLESQTEPSFDVSELELVDSE